MHHWTKEENIICILCFKLYNHLSFHSQINKIHAILPHLSKNSIGMKIANIRNLENNNIGLKNSSKILKNLYAVMHKH